MRVVQRAAESCLCTRVVAPGVRGGEDAAVEEDEILRVAVHELVLQAGA